MANIVERITAFNAGRNPELVKRKYHEMRHDPFSFFRGTCHLFYEDWTANPPLKSAPAIWVCGDLHLQNFGCYQGDDGLIYFDVNDFDEGALGPFVWDVARLMMSILVSFPKMNHAQKMGWAQVYLTAYTDVLAAGQIRSIHTAVAEPPLRSFLQKREKCTQTDLLNEYTKTGDKGRRIDPHTKNTAEIKKRQRQKAMTVLKHWSSSQPDANAYEVIDAAIRLSGIGSMGVERYLLLVKGVQTNQLVELKQRLDPVSGRYSDSAQPKWANPAERVVTLQTRLQTVPPTPFAAISYRGIAYTLRKLYPADAKVDVMNFKKAESRKAYITTLGQVTAYAHLRGCGRQDAASADDLSRFAADSDWRKAILDYAQVYSQQVKADFDEFCQSELGKGET